LVAKKSQKKSKTNEQTKKDKPKEVPAKEKKETKPKKSKKIVVDNKLRRIWWKLRKAYNMNYDAFVNTLYTLTDDEANFLYDIVVVSLFKGSYAEILQEHPGLRELVKSDDDRLFMHDIYEHLSWRLGRKEEFPEDIKLKFAMKGKIGRMSTSKSNDFR